MPTRYSNYVVPSEEMGEYEFGAASRRRSAPSRPSGGGLYPLTEEGTYGPPPGPPPGEESEDRPNFSRFRERFNNEKNR